VSRKYCNATATAPSALASPFAGATSGTIAITGLPRPWFGHVIIIVLENHEAGQVFGNRSAPYFNGLARDYRLESSYYAIRHPSLPNYLWLEAKCLSWKSYVLSPQIKGGGYSNSVAYSHSSTLRSLQEIFGVTPLLGDAANATDLSDLFRTFPVR